MHVGVNNLLREILEHFQEDDNEVCFDTADIYKSQTRGYQELHTGMLRLTCLLKGSFLPIIEMSHYNANFIFITLVYRSISKLSSQIQNLII